MSNNKLKWLAEQYLDFWQEYLFPVQGYATMHPSQPSPTSPPAPEPTTDDSTS